MIITQELTDKLIQGLKTERERLDKAEQEKDEQLKQEFHKRFSNEFETVEQEITYLVQIGNAVLSSNFRTCLFTDEFGFVFLNTDMSSPVQYRERKRIDGLGLVRVFNGSQLSRATDSLYFVTDQKLWTTNNPMSHQPDNLQLTDAMRPWTNKTVLNNMELFLSKYEKFKEQFIEQVQVCVHTK